MQINRYVFADWQSGEGLSLYVMPHGLHELWSELSNGSCHDFKRSGTMDKWFTGPRIQNEGCRVHGCIVSCTLVFPCRVARSLNSEIESSSAFCFQVDNHFVKSCTAAAANYIFHGREREERRLHSSGECTTSVVCLFLLLHATPTLCWNALLISCPPPLHENHTIHSITRRTTE